MFSPQTCPACNASHEVSFPANENPQAGDKYKFRCHYCRKEAVFTVGNLVPAKPGSTMLPVTAERAGAEDESRPAQSLKILIIEDDPDLADLIQIFLEEDGHVTNKAYTRTDGSDYLRTVKYDCVILDNFMVGMNATDFLNGLQMQLPAPAVVLITGSASPDVIAKNLGVKHFLPKPFDSARLLAAVKRACAGR